MAEKIDVVVPCYKYGHFLEACVKSVLSQTGVDVRVLIIDDASPDNTPDVCAVLAAGDDRVIYYRHETNKGHIATYNEGIDLASGDLFLLLSADDYLVPGALARAAQIMREQPEVGFTFGNVIHLAVDGTMTQVSALGRNTPAGDAATMSGEDFIRRSGARNIVPTPTAVVRTSLQKEVGGYDRNLPHAGDMEMWLRLASRSAVGFVNDAQAVYRWHGANMSLGYFWDSVIPDLHQRKLVLETFETRDRSHFGPDTDLFDLLYKDLAVEALHHANRAFNGFDRTALESIKQFALQLHPDIRRSLPWAKLAFKQMLGFETWQTLNMFRSRFAGTTLGNDGAK